MKSTLPERRLIPKWRPVATTLESPEAGSHKDATVQLLSGDKDELEKAIAEWKEHRSPGMLGEVLSFSVHPDLLPRVLDIGSEAVRSGDELTSVQAALITELSQSNGEGALIDAPPQFIATDTHPFQVPMRRLRSLLRSQPDNALALLDMAQLQSAIGKTESAERSIRMALNLAPNNRTVIRTAARFYVHADKHDQAHQLVRRHQRTPGDPWLMASEIALADLAGTESGFLSKGKRFLIDQRSISDAHLTELSGVIAMEEYRAGNLKRARDAQRRALLSPNDNMVAQAFEHRARFGIELETPQILNALAHSHEALVLKAWTEMSPDQVEHHAQAWHSEEPFSSRPIQLLSTLYLFQGDYTMSDRWISAGLTSDPLDRGLLTNQAFLRARAGQGAEMTSILRRLRARHLQEVEPYAKAIEGLYEYAQGRFDSGDNLYGQAVEQFLQLRRPELAAYCQLFQALVSADFNHPRETEIVSRASAALNEHPTFDAVMLLTIRTLPDLQVKLPVEQARRRLSQLIFDPEKNTLTVKHGVTSVGAKPVVIKSSK